MTNNILDGLIDSGDIKSYFLETVKEEPNSKFRDTERLTITFASGKVLILNTFCSGCSENTCFIIEQ